MKRIFACAGAALLALSAQADYIARNGDDSVRITDHPCPAEVAKQVEWGSKGKLAISVVGGKTFAACWIGYSNGMVVLQYEDGDQGMVPMSEFKKAPEA